MENNRSSNNQARYIEVYNKILKNIKEGLYDGENKLPNENTLSKQMGVSRMTLRQSLLLLQEDGIIESRKGVGNFIRKQAVVSQDGLEQINNVLEKCGIKDIDNIVCSPRLSTSNYYSDNTFDRKVNVLCGSNLYFYSKGKCYAHCFSIIPMDLDFISNYDMMDSEQALKLIIDDIYDYAKAAKLEIRIIEDEDNLIENEFKGESKLFVLVVEKILDYTGQIICLNKYHIPIEYADIKINALKK